MAPPFEEFDISDADSISITSTQPSDVAPEYDVEKILSEERQQDSGEMMYLVKWESYPLHLSTWEPAEQLLAGSILSDWQREKDAVKAGVAQPFDMDLYWEVREKYEDEKEERKKRRAAKRRKLGLPSRSESVANRSADDFDARDAAESSEDDEPPRGRQKQVEGSNLKRKGVAQKVKTNSNRQVTMIISSDESDADGEGEHSLLKKSRKKSAAKASAGDSVTVGKAVSRAVTKPAASGAHGTIAPAASVTPANKVTQKRLSARSTAPPKKIAAAGPLPPVATSTNSAKRTQPSSSARKSAPSTASAFGNNATAPRLPVLPYDPPKRKAPADPLAGFGKSAPERKARVLSATNPKNHRFSNLAEENRVRKHSAKEVAPDPNVLGTFNFSTNTYDDPVMKPRGAALSSASAANNVFGRREAPAPARQRSVSPLSTTTGTRPAPATLGGNTTPYRRVCWDWRGGGGCQNDRCTFAHHYITCPEWRQGKCPKREIDCKFDHKEEGRDPVYVPANEWNNGAFFPGHNANAIPQGIVQPVRKLSRPSIPAPSLLPPGKQLVTFLKPKQIPCQYWARGMCFKSATDCIYPHYDTGAPLNPKEITCGYWLAQDGCNRSKRCTFAHYETAYSTLGPRNESTITCSFWLAGRCTKLRCEFDHYETGCRSMGPPGTAPIDAREVSPGEVVDDEPIAANPSAVNPGAVSPGHSHPGAAQMTAAKTIAAQAIAAKIITAAQKTDAQTPAAETTAAQTQTGPVKVGVAPTANMTPASQRPSLPARQKTDQLAFINDVALEVKFGDFCFTAATQLACATGPDAIVLNDAIGPNPQLFMEHTMDEELLRTEVANSLKTGASFSTGDIICKDPRRDYAQTLADELRQISKCGIIQSPAYTMIVHPIGTGEWAFLTQDGDAKSSQAPLKFILLPALASKLPTSNEVASEDTNEDATDTPQEYSLTSADMERLLKISDIKTEDKVFIMMPPSKVNEMQRMAKVFEDRFKQPDYAGRETNVWTSQEKGKWDYLAAKLQRANGGLLILDCELPLFDIPHLATVLHHSAWRVFSVGANPHVADFGRPAPGPGCQRLFPMGDAVFVTDELFINTPEKVLRIIDEVNRQNKGKPPGAPRAKIAARPGVKMWLMKFVTEHPQGASDPRWLKLLHAVWDLCPFDKQSMFHPGNPSKEADMISEPPDMMPTHQTLLDKGDKAAATDWIVNWFAGWAFMNAAEYRRFTVCHEEPGTGKPGMDGNYNPVLVDHEADPRGWAKQYGYVLCMTPDQWLKEKAKTRH
jgi:hypothetical protein